MCIRSPIRSGWSLGRPPPTPVGCGHAPGRDRGCQPNVSLPVTARSAAYTVRRASRLGPWTHPSRCCRPWVSAVVSGRYERSRCSSRPADARLGRRTPGTPLLDTRRSSGRLAGPHRSVRTGRCSQHARPRLGRAGPRHPRGGGVHPLPTRGRRGRVGCDAPRAPRHPPPPQREGTGVCWAHVRHCAGEAHDASPRLRGASAPPSHFTRGPYLPPGMQLRLPQAGARSWPLYQSNLKHVTTLMHRRYGVSPAPARCVQSRSSVRITGLCILANISEAAPSFVTTWAETSTTAGRES